MTILDIILAAALFAVVYGVGFIAGVLSPLSHEISERIAAARGWGPYAAEEEKKVAKENRKTKN